MFESFLFRKKYKSPVNCLSLLLSVCLIAWSSIRSHAQVAFSDTTFYVCDSLQFQMGIEPVNGYTYVWTPEAGLTEPTSSYTDVLLGNNNGEEFQAYQFQLSVYNEAGNLAIQKTYNINVFSFFDFGIDLGFYSICPGETLSLAQPPEITGIPQVNPSVYATATAEGEWLFYPPDTTAFTLSVIDTLYCSRINYGFQVNVPSIEPAVILTPERRICSSDIATDTLEIEFSPPGGFLLGPGVYNDSIFSADLAGSGMHQLVYRIFNQNCLSSDTLSIEVVGSDVVELTGPGNLCRNDTLIELNFGNPSGGTYFLNGELIEALNPSLLDIGQQQLIYRVEWDSGCVFDKSKLFYIIPLPPRPVLTSADADLTACVGDSIVVSTTQFPNYGWSNGALGSTQTLFESQEDLFVWFRSNTGCYAYSDTVQVSITSPGNLNLSALEYNNGYQLSANGSNDGEISWQMEGGYPSFEASIDPPRGEIFNNSFGGLGAGQYFVTVVDSAGCIALDSIILRQPNPIIPIESLKIPNSFTPNGDGFNDFFVITGLQPDYSKNKFLVFNMKRQLVYSADNYSNTWNGESNEGKKLPEGNYFIVFESEKLNEAARLGIYLKRN